MAKPIINPKKIKSIVKRFQKELHGGDIAGDKYSEYFMGPLEDMLRKKYDLDIVDEPMEGCTDEDVKKYHKREDEVYNKINDAMEQADEIASEAYLSAFVVAFVRLEKLIFKDEKRRRNAPRR